MSTITDTPSVRTSISTKREDYWSVRGNETEGRGTFSTTVQLGEVSNIGWSDSPHIHRSHRGKRTGSETSQPKVKRRIQGFFIQEEGQEARVALVDNGTVVHYHLPLSLLHSGGVRHENQPFELDELEAKVAGVVMRGYKVKASAPAEASEIRPLPLNEEYQSKLNRILRR